VLTESSKPQLIGPVWRWQQTLMNDGRGLIPDNPGNYTVHFMADGNVAVQADCNQVLGDYIVDGSSLSVTLGPSTLAACPEGSLAGPFVTNLGAASTYYFQDGMLFIDLLMASGTMQFEAQSTALAGTFWEVTGYNNGRGGVVSTLLETTLTAAFDAGGRVGGSAGCNRYNASYEVSDGNITIGLPGATKKVCEQPEGVMEQEQAFLAALHTAATYRFRGDRLELHTTEGALAVTFRRLLSGDDF
jgi:heat shock protein HslJ